MLSCGIVGLPNAGKSTLFNALTRAGAAVANYPFTTIDPNVGIVAVPDERLGRIASIVRPEQVTPAAYEFVDIAGLVRGASHGEGLGNQFLGHIRSVDAIAMVVRGFADPDVPHIYDDVDPLRDIEVVNTELALADLQTVERRIERAKTASKSGDKKALDQLELFHRLERHLSERRTARDFPGGDEWAEVRQDTGLLTDKPLLYVLNVDEDDLSAAIAAVEGRGSGDGLWSAVIGKARAEGTEVVPVAAKLDSEITELSEEDAAAYLREIGVESPGLHRLIKASYRLLCLITFFTATGEKEVRAWPVPQGTKAPQAAGKVHTDMEHGFIRAEVVAYDDLVRSGTFSVARDKGLVRVEGKDYVVQDGDIVHFRFHV